MVNKKEKVKKSHLKIKVHKKKESSKKKGKLKQDGEVYLHTGIPGFDILFDKHYGIPSGASVLIEGGPGSGKTIFCLATADGLCKQGKKCLYMSFEEPEERLMGHMRHFKWDVDGYIKKGLLRVKRFDALDVSRSVEALLSAAKKELLIEIDPVLFPEDFTPDFVVIDSLSSIASAFSGHESRFRIYMEQLFRYLENNKITNFLIREVATPSHIGATYKEEGEAVSFLSDGIVVLYNVIYENGGRACALEVLKMRGASFEKKIVEFKIINNKGIEVNPNKVISKDRQKGFVLT
ncbi:hypothetical protein J4461_03770 [Candidatus Pacearchaeota archaeon]|nr:hypothetical protein [Candidatus Pacearchaeota archaeon]